MRVSRLPVSAFFIPIALLLLAFAVRTLGLADQSLWYDEGYTVMLAQRDAGTIIRQVAALDFNTPLHYLLLGMWMRAGAGTTEFATRLFFVCADVISVALAVRLAQLSGVHRAAWLAMLFAGLSPVAVFFAREARMYAQLSMFCMLALTQLLACLRVPSSRGWYWWALWNVAIVSTHIIGVFIVTAQLVVLVGLWLTHRVRHTAAPMIAVVVSASSIVAWVAVIFLLKTEFVGFFPAHLDYAAWVMQGLASVLIPHIIPAALIAPMAIVSAFVLIGIFIRSPERLGIVALVIGLCIAFTAVFIAWFGKGSYRYTGYLGLLFSAVFGVAIARQIEARLILLRITGWVVAVVAGIGCVIGVFAIQTLPQYRQEDFRGAAQYLQFHAGEDEKVLLVAGHLAPVYQYYAGKDGWVALPADQVLLLDHALDYNTVVPLLNHALTAKQGAWVLRWQDDLIDPSGVVESLLRRISHELAPSETITRFHGLQLQHYRFDDVYVALPEQVQLAQSSVEVIGNEHGLSGLGCAQLRPPHIGDPLMEVLCFWQLKPYVALPYDMQVSLRLTDATGKQVVQSDQTLAPARGLPYIPFEKPITSVYFIPIPVEMAPGEYTLRAVPYLPSGEISPQVTTPVRVLAR